MPTWFDALVIGGGPAGATSAILLAQAGWSVAVVERTPFPRRKVCGEFLSATNLPTLERLGVVEPFLAMAGPEVRRVGIFTASATVIADMPHARVSSDGNIGGWGRALGREHLDTLLLDRAAAAGASVFQPATVTAISRSGDGHLATVVSGAARHITEVHARTVIAAHGSWDSGHLPTQPLKRRPRPADLLGFKAHVVNVRLATGLMPLLAFPGGYGGMVQTDHHRVSLSCCIRRDRLAECRRAHPLLGAGDALLAHIITSSSVVRDVLDGAALDGGWHAAGPIRPGVRRANREGIFLVGNAAGEAHPVIAEGISMAMQGASLLADHLIAGTSRLYAADWRRTFSPRIHAASLIAYWAMRPMAVGLTLPLLRAFPAVLTAGAWTSGKTSALCSSSS